MNKQGNSPYLFIGGHGRAYALDKLNGSIVWDTQFKKGFFRAGNSFVTLSEGVDFLYAFTYGIAFCLDKYTGKIVWKKPIKELKHHPGSMAVDATLLGGGFDAGSTDSVESDAGGDGDGDGDGGD